MCSCEWETYVCALCSFSFFVAGAAVAAAASFSSLPSTRSFPVVGFSSSFSFRLFFRCCSHFFPSGSVMLFPFQPSLCRCCAFIIDTYTHTTHMLSCCARIYVNSIRTVCAWSSHQILYLPAGHGRSGNFEQSLENRYILMCIVYAVRTLRVRSRYT